MLYVVWIINESMQTHFLWDYLINLGSFMPLQLNLKMLPKLLFHDELSIPP